MINKVNNLKEDSAILTTIRGGFNQFYAQQKWSLTGPNKKLNEKLLEEIRSSTVFRNEGYSDYKMTSLPKSPSTITKRQLVKDIFYLGEKVDFPKSIVKKISQHHAWKIERIGIKNPKKILAVGVSNGGELIALRAMYPRAEIFVCDWIISLSKKMIDELNIKNVKKSTICEYLKHNNEFDIIYTNHVLEHMFNPDETISLLFKSLKKGGVLSSGMPLEGDVRNPLKNRTIRLLSGKAFYRKFNMGTVNIGHPWKTTYSDLCLTLRRSGFKKIEFFKFDDYTAAWHIVNPLPKEKVAKNLKIRLILEKLIFGTIRNIFYKIDKVPNIILRVYYNFMHASWFGESRIVADFTPEVFFVAKK